MTQITAEQLRSDMWDAEWGPIDPPAVRNPIATAQAILDEDRLATTAAVLAMAAAKCRANADEAKGYNLPQMALGGYQCAETIMELNPDATAWLAARDAAMREEGRKEALQRLQNTPLKDREADLETMPDRLFAWPYNPGWGGYWRKDALPNVNAAVEYVRVETIAETKS